jgi:hypothetical protein
LPQGFSAEGLNKLPPGQYVSIADVVALLAFGPDLTPMGLNAIEESAARFRTGLALIDAARDRKVTLFGLATYGRPSQNGSGP